MKIYLYIIILLFFLSISNASNATTYYCNGCSDCESKINSASAGDNVRLSADITINESHSCIIFEKGNIEFDCRGHLIDGHGKGVGIAIWNIRMNSITIKNCMITNFTTGIDIWGFNNTITKNNIQTEWLGIHIKGGSFGNTIVNNAVNSNMIAGIYLGDSFDNIIANNTVTLNMHGLSVYNSSNNRIDNNNINSNYESGIGLWYYSSNNIIIDNTINSNSSYYDCGIYIADYSNNNTINSNEICSSTGLDFYINSSSKNQGNNNTCDKPDEWNDQGTIGCTHSCSGIKVPIRSSASEIPTWQIVVIMIGILAIVLYIISTKRKKKPETQ